MAQISGNTVEKRIYPGKLNRVVNIAEIKWYAFEFTNSEGRADVAFAALFGKDSRDGKAHIAVVEPQNLKSLLTEPHPHILEGIRALLGQHNAPAVDLPVGGIGGASFGAEGTET